MVWPGDLLDAPAAQRFGNRVLAELDRQERPTWTGDYINHNGFAIAFYVVSALRQATGVDLFYFHDRSFFIFSCTKLIGFTLLFRDDCHVNN